MTDNAKVTAFAEACRTFSSFIDRGVYGLLNIVYQVFFNITSVDLFQNEVMMKFYGRIQLILGVFMMFQLAMTILKGIVDPNSFTDSKSGAGNLVYRVATSLILLTVLVPISTPGRNEFEKRVNNNGILFGTLYSLQYRILNNNTIGKLILGTTDDNSSMVSTGNQKNDVEYSSRVFTATILRSFYRINLIEESKRTHVDGKEDEMINANRMCQDIDDTILAAYTKVDADVGDIVSPVNETCNLVNKKFAFYYWAFVCPIIGIIFVVVFLSFCAEIAIRSVKLAVLRLIAPIPIISYMDPKGGKDNAFSSWVKTLTSTYLDLFIRLAAVYFVLFVVQDMLYSGIRINTSGGMVGSISLIMIWIGLFIFAKQAPKFIKQAIGLKEDAGGGFFSGLGAYAGVLGMIGSFRSNWRATDEENRSIPGRQGHTIRNLARNFGSGIVGGIAGAYSGVDAMSGKEPGIKSVLNAQHQRNARRASHSTLPGRFVDSAYGMFTGRSYADSTIQEGEVNKEAFSSLKKWKDSVKAEAMKNGGSFDFTLSNGQVLRGVRYSEVMAGKEAGADKYGNITINGQKYQASLFGTDVTDRIADAQVDAWKAGNVYIDSDPDKNGKTWDQVVIKESGKLYADHQRTIKAVNDAEISVGGKSGQALVDSYGDLGAAMGIANRAHQRTETDMRQIMRKANKQENKK